MPTSIFLYDKQDRYFLRRVNQIIKYNRENDSKPQSLMHPNGIIDLTTAPELRMASAVLSLLDTLQTRESSERLNALENLHNEVLLTARTKFRRNTARVLIELMKEIVRAYGNEDLQFKLVHDFRMAAQGKPNIVRKLLKKYNLLEMPEAWNQLVFDHHVHDANTKGRKRPTHLIMDAWVKGIRSLTVIYYNYVAQEAGQELVRAAEIMGIKIRIGILFNAVFRHKLIDIIWVPQGFSDSDAFISFLSEEPMLKLTAESIEASKWREKFTLNIFKSWNDSLRHDVAQELKLTLNPIEEATFFEFVGLGQGSILHLAELIHKISFPSLKERADYLNNEIKNTSDDYQKTLLMNELKSIDMLTPEYFLEILEDCEKIQEKHIIAEIISADDNNNSSNNNDVPKILREKPTQILQRLHDLCPSSSIILNLANSSPEEVLNLLWDSKGLISHLEIVNVYDWHNGNAPYILEINELMEAINTNNTPNLKQIIQSLMHACEKEEKHTFFDIYKNHVKHKAILNETKQLTILKNASQTKETNTTYLYRDCEIFVSPPEMTQQATSTQVILPQEKENLSTDSENEDLEERIIIHETKEMIETEKHVEAKIKEITTKLKNPQECKTIDPANHKCQPNPLEKYKNNPQFELLSCEERIEKLRNILHHITILTKYYKRNKLFTRMGTDSTSRVGRLAGTGLAYIETLPKRAIRELQNGSNASRLLLPVRKEITEIITYRIPFAKEKITTLTKILRTIPFLKHLTFQKTRHWDDGEAHTTVFNDGICSNDLSSFSANNGNIITLGGVGVRTTNKFNAQKNNNEFHTTQINTNILNILKLFIGFIPAFFSFQYTQDISFLAWFGALIWFLITGFRNVIQAVLGGGGLQRSPLLRWNNYVSWSRLCDSLMYTGISVVLLELIVRNFILQETLNITSLNAPLFTFSVIAILNGMYIVFHNIVRGLQPEAIIGNFFRSFLSIPLALVYNNVFNSLLIFVDIQNVDMIILSSSAILSKVASDTVAGVIEGLADKRSNIWFRRWDYQLAIKKMYANYSMLELEFPEQDVLKMLHNPQKTLDILKVQNPNLYTRIILNALDFMYFHYYQPRSLSTLKDIIHNLSDMERLSWLRVQSVLNCQRDVSQLFIDGLVNENFSRALSFYLDKYETYLNELETLYQTRIQQDKQSK